MIRERAEWDKQEHETLENLKMTLETEKRRIEDQLEGERALSLDKDALLERTKRRVSELEEVASLQADLETLDSQLDRAQKESEDKVGDIIFLLIGTDKTVCRDLVKDRSVSLEQDARHSKEQLVEMACTATQYSTMIQQKEEDVACFISELASSNASERNCLNKLLNFRRIAIGLWWN